MKFKTVLKQVSGEYTRDGVTIPRTRNEEVSMPVLPRNWQDIALKGAVGVVVGLTLAAIAWSTWSIGDLLGGGIGFVVAVVFDIGWAIALVLEYLSRYDKRKRVFPERLGWALLVVTMMAIGWHGLAMGSWPMAVVGAFVSFFAKILWIGVMKHVNAELSEDDQAWLTHQVSEAQTKAAVAQVRRATARIETRATMEILAMERELNDVREAFGLPATGSELVVAEEVESFESAPTALELPAPSLADMGKSDAIKFVRKARPELEATEIVDLLAEHEVETTTDYVNRILAKASKPELDNVVSIEKSLG